jgi:SAM-dependent methyltransferase
MLHAFGDQPIAGYLTGDEDGARNAPRLPLAIALCARCGLVQQAYDAARTLLVDEVYSRYYPTYTASTGVPAYVDAFATHAAVTAGAAPGDLVVEIGSNDGALLGLLMKRGFRAAGFEPAANLNAIARKSGAEIVEGYFGADAAVAFREGRPAAKLVLSRHTLEHAFDPVDFVAGIGRILAPDGLAVIEVPYLPAQMVRNHFEAMTFQHVSFFTVGALDALVSRAGLIVVDVRFVSMDGGSIVIFLKHAGASPAGRVRDLAEQERRAGLAAAGGYRDFFERVERVRRTAALDLSHLRERGWRTIGYGAGGKGQSLLNLLGLHKDILPCVRDDTPGNAGRWIPGAAIPVVDGADPRSASPDAVLLTAPTHIPEMLERIDRRALCLATVPDWHFVPRPQLG